MYTSERASYLHCSYPAMASDSVAWMLDAIGAATLTPPASIRSEMSSCSHARMVCTRSVGAGEYVPAHIVMSHFIKVAGAFVSHFGQARL